MDGQSNKWAVLVGVNHYSDSDPTMNLNGCYHLNVPETSSEFTDELDHIPRQDATRNNVFTAIDQVAAQARTGDYVHIHFSGHGDRQDTQYHPDKKLWDSKDEVLCLPDGDITDVEFGDRLDKMASSLVVLVTLDCCFSGGATRRENSKVRCKSNYVPPTDGYYNRGSAASESQSTRGARTAIPTQSWLYRNRDYNAITACHPYEEAHENCPKSGKWQGALTRNLMTCLDSIGRERVSTTYAQLHGFLDALIKQQLRGLQQPMLLGERNRLLFEPTIVPETASHAPAYVIGFSNGNVVINRGKSSGSVLGDVYSLRGPGTSDTSVPAETAILIRITFLDAFSSNGEILQDPNASGTTSSQNIKVGWLATRIGRPTVSYAQVLEDPSDSSKRLLSEIKKNWESFIDPVVKVEIIFPEPPNKTTFINDIRFYINLQGSTCTILNKEKRPFENFPILTEQTPEFTKRLMYLLGHLETYLFVNELKTTKSQASKFKLSVEEINDDQRSAEHTSTWNIHFENLSLEVLFVTIFNLSPLYGIQKIVPFQAAFAQPVESNREFNQIVDIEIPSSLQLTSQNPSFQMTDVIKTFVTVQPVDLRHLELPDLVDTTPSQLRHVRPREAKRSSWWVEENKIITGPIQPGAG
ncbi:hypothetical protein F5Y04DRAFT_290447 [Hypomontagnella monticulosa]|nr:hypothetical protein F5Y04DRAFT_290447 [Hypomontagnella monticulosa]